MLNFKINLPTKNCLMMSLNDRVVRLKYTNFILTNDSELDKEEKIKIKCYFLILFLFDFRENWIRRNC